MIPQKGGTMAEATMVTFHLRNGEQRTYQDITRLDTSRPHTVLVYYQDTLIAQIAKNDIVRISQQPAERQWGAREPDRRRSPKSRREGTASSGHDVCARTASTIEGDKEFFQPSVAVRAHDDEVGVACPDLLWNNLSRVPRHNETLDRRARGHIWHDVFETLVQQRLDAIQVMR